MHDYLIRLAMLGMLSHTVAAEDEKVDVKPRQLGVVIIQGQSNVRDVSTDPERSPIMMSRVILDDDTARFESVESILEKQEGVQIRRSGTQGSFSSLSIRGSSSNQVRVFMDGSPLGFSSGGTVDLSNIRLDELASIEIYRGSVPARFGVSPMGGLINLITKEAYEQKIKGKLKFGVGSFGLLFANLDARYANEKLNALVALNHIESDGDYDYIDDRLTPNNASDDVERTRINNDLDQQSAMAKLKYYLHEQRFIEANFSALDKEKGLPGTANNQSRFVRYNQEEQRAALRFGFEELGDESTHAKFSLYHQQLNENYVDTFGNSGELGLGRQDTDNTSKEFGGELFWEKAFGDHQVESLFRINQESYEPKDRLSNNVFPESDRDTFSVTLQDTFEINDGQWLFLPSVRYQNIQNKIRREAPGTVQIADDESHRKFNWSFGTRYFASEQWSIKSNIATALRLPAFNELFGDRGVTVGNNDLKLEESFNFDLGIDWTKPLEAWNIEKHTISLNYFENHRKNLIQFVFDARGVGRAINISKGEVKGIEWSHSFDFFEKFYFIHRYTLTDSEITHSPFRTDLGKAIPGVYESGYYAKVEYTHKKIKTYLEYIAEDDMFYDKTNLLQAPDKRLYNLGVAYQFKKAEVALTGVNLGDEQLEDYAGWPLPGRHFIFSLRVHF